MEPSSALPPAERVIQETSRQHPRLSLESLAATVSESPYTGIFLCHQLEAEETKKIPNRHSYCRLDQKDREGGPSKV